MFWIQIRIPIFLVGEKNLPGFGSGSGLRFLAVFGSGFNEHGSETLASTVSKEVLGSNKFNLNIYFHNLKQ